MVKQRARRNPPLIAFANPPRGRQMLSKRVFALAYKHVEDGKAYRHEFRAGVCCELLPDGSVRLYSTNGKPLWGDF